MKIVILCKRRPQQKDLWERPYGRFYGLAKSLADQGNEVHLVLLNYKNENEFQETRNGITWYSVNLLPNPLRYYLFTRKLVTSLSPNWIIGFSDTYFGICADTIGRHAGVKTLIDAYDNYESYISWCLPLHWLWRRSLRRCTAITAAGPGLLAHMSEGRSTANTAVIEMAADDNFIPGSKHEARAALGLPQDALTVVYSGSLYRSRGIQELFELIELTRELNPDASWLLSGRLEPGVELPGNCRHLGYVDDDKVVDVLRSADVIVCVNRPGSFGDYSYPVKIYEALSTGIPVVAFKTTSVEYVMREHLENLVAFGDSQTMAAKICDTLANPAPVKASTSHWQALGARLHKMLMQWESKSG